MRSLKVLLLLILLIGVQVCSVLSQPIQVFGRSSVNVSGETPYFKFIVEVTDSAFAAAY